MRNAGDSQTLALATVRLPAFGWRSTERDRERTRDGPRDLSWAAERGVSCPSFVEHVGTEKTESLRTLRSSDVDPDN